MKKKIPEMIAGNWHPTSDPTGRRVRFTDFTGAVIQGTVGGVEYQEDREPTVFVVVAKPATKRGVRGVSANRLTWLDGPPWAESKYPFGLWVMFSDANGVERSGCVYHVDSCHSPDAVLTIVQMDGTEVGDTVEMPWTKVECLPE